MGAWQRPGGSVTPTWGDLGLCLVLLVSLIRPHPAPTIEPASPHGMNMARCPPVERQSAPSSFW